METPVRVRLLEDLPENYLTLQDDSSRYPDTGETGEAYDVELERGADVVENGAVRHAGEFLAEQRVLAFGRSIKSP